MLHKEEPPIGEDQTSDKQEPLLPRVSAASVALRAKTPIREVSYRDENGGLDRSTRDINHMVTPNNQPPRMLNKHLSHCLSPRPFSVSKSIEGDFMLKCPRDSSNAFAGLLNVETDETAMLRKLVSF